MSRLTKLMIHALMVLTVTNLVLIYNLLADHHKPSHYVRKLSYESYYKGVDPEILPYLHAIEDELGHPVPHFKMIFVEDLRSKNEDAVGTCNRLSRTIKIKRSTWDTYGELTRENLLLHEIGHCYFDLDHDDELLDDGCPANLMHHQIIPKKCYIRYRNIYIEQLSSL